MTEKFTLREPEYRYTTPDLDLSFWGWLKDKRDAKGRWASKADQKIMDEITADTARRTKIAEANKGASLKLIDSTLNTNRPKPAARDLTTEETRRLFQLSPEQRESLFEATGLQAESKYKGVDDLDLVHRVIDHPEEAADIDREVRRRQQMNALVAKTMHVAAQNASREKTRSWSRQFDDHLQQTKVGRGVLKVRDSLLSDAALDTAGEVKEKGGEKVKDFVKDIATKKLIQFLVTGVSTLAGHLLAVSPDLPEKLSEFTEQVPVDAALTGLLGGVVAVAMSSLGKAAKKSVSKVKLKEPA